ncbi:MAG: hypothetical protein LBL07_03180 [Tannerella sp.]|jgi:hypothetical protein|nr:hypothetical protein [Tannerella sp.]
MNVTVKDYDSRDIFQFNGNGAGDHFKKAGVIPEEHRVDVETGDFPHVCLYAGKR